MRSSIGPGVITEHRVTHPEITVDGDEANAVWYLQDRVIAAEFNFMLIGAAFYHDAYRRTADGWKISATGYDRTYEATMSLEALNFKLKPGRGSADLRSLLRDRDHRTGPQPLDDLHQGAVVERDASRGRSAVGGVHEEAGAVAWDAFLGIDAHHHRVDVFGNVEVFAGRCVEVTLRLSCRC